MTDAVADFQELVAGGPFAPVSDPYSIYRRLRDEQPALRLGGRKRPTFVVSRHDDVRDVLRDNALFSSRANARGTSLVMGRTIVEMDGAEHLRHRKLITPSLAPRALRGDFPELVRKLAHTIADEFPADGLDLVPDFTFRYPLRVFVEILGLPADEVQRFHEWAAALSLIQIDPGKALDASKRMREALLPIVQRKRSEPGDDLISSLAAAEVDGARMDDEEVVSFLRLLVSAGAETTFHLLGSALHVLLEDPGLQARVREDAALIEPLLWETLRWETPVAVLPREATADTQIAGVEMPQGSELMLLIGSACRDERHYAEPDRFELERDNSDSLAFGLGKHYCAGSRLALLEARIGLEVLFERLGELRPAPGERSEILGFAFRGPDALRVARG